jgi:hypothetical protein
MLGSTPARDQVELEAPSRQQQWSTSGLDCDVKGEDVTVELDGTIKVGHEHDR